MLSNHPHDNASNKQRSEDWNSTTSNSGTKKDDEVIESPTLSFTQLEGKCYVCRKGGHRSNTCQDRDKIPKEEWAINKAKNKSISAQQYVHADATSNALTSEASNQDDQKEEASLQANPLAWIGCHLVTTINNTWFQGFQKYFANMRDIILLDNQSEVSLFCNSKMVENIMQGAHQLQIITNGGKMTSTLQATASMADDHQVWFEEKAMMNILNFAKMENCYKVTYDHE